MSDEANKSAPKEVEVEIVPEPPKTAKPVDLKKVHADKLLLKEETKKKDVDAKARF